MCGNLVVCKASIINQWLEEFESKVAESVAIRVVKYHEPKGGEEKWKKEIRNADVVLTTYGMVERDEGILIRENFKYDVYNETLLTIINEFKGGQELFWMRDTRSITLKQ